MAEQADLHLWSDYGDLYNQIVRPERKYAISHYMRTQWAPLLGAARLWFVIALRQRCYWNNKRDWCVVDKRTLARESGLSQRTVNRIVSTADDPATDDYASWFFYKARRRRYSERIGRTVNAPNRYRVLLDDPLTPPDPARLRHPLRQAVTDDSPSTTLRVLRELGDCSDAELRTRLPTAPETSGPEGTVPAIVAGFCLDVVQDCCPMPQPDSPEYAEIARAASRLHNALTRPEHVYMGNQYFRLQWLPALGPVLATLVVHLRARSYWNERTGELRDTCRARWAELARAIGCTARQLRNLRRKPDLARFLTVLDEGHGRSATHFRVQMLDPLVDADQERFGELCGTIGMGDRRDEPIDPETGQLNTYALLKPEVLAHGDRRARTTVRPALQTEAVTAHPPAGKAEILAHRASTLSTDCGQGVDISGISQLSAPFPPDKQEILAHRDGDARIDDLSTVQTERTEKGVAADNAENLAHSRLVQQPRAQVGNAEVLAQSQPLEAETLAHSKRKFWRIEGLNAEILAQQSGNFGRYVKLHLITFSEKGLTETARDLSPAVLDDERLLADAVLDELFSALAIQEPNRGKLLARHPRCAWVVAWTLYALTQRGLSQNKAGYVYNRLMAGDAPPADFIRLAGLSPPEWRTVYHDVRIGQDERVADDLYWAYALCKKLLVPVWERLSFSFLSLEAEGERVSEAPEPGVRAPPVFAPENVPSLQPLSAGASSQGQGAITLPEKVRALLGGDEIVEREGDGLVIVTPALYQAYRLGRAAERAGGAIPIAVYFVDRGGQEHVLNAEILALSVEALPTEAWDALRQELPWHMTPALYERWWRDVQPLGVVARGDEPDVRVILGVFTAAARDWLTARQRTIVERALSGILGHPVRVRFVLCVAEKELFQVER
jgi:hypothetical protein